MHNISQPRSESCPRCTGYTKPQVKEIDYGNKIVTEAHYVCHQCGTRFKIGILGERAIDDTQG